jgi:23S rRNA (adenine1618-N6)-methyltransferase
MAKQERPISSTKNELHPRNPHREHYDFARLSAALPALATFVKPNKYGQESIDFFDPQAVKALNKALLKSYYQIEEWDIPAGYLCPPVPGRADYLHHLADLLFSDKKSGLGTQAYYNERVKCLDIGVGANCIYPIIGSSEYGWAFVGSDIDQLAIKNAQRIVDGNERLAGKVELRLQNDQQYLLTGIIKEGERYELTICNPPFHPSAAAAKAAHQRKLTKLKKTKTTQSKLNFGGQHHELWTEGGEKEFISNLIRESKTYATSSYWFTSLVSQQASLPFLYHQLKQIKAIEVKTIEMGQGNKTSRILAWTFLNPKQRKAWSELIK